jgi:hypothetical protein
MDMINSDSRYDGDTVGLCVLRKKAMGTGPADQQSHYYIDNLSAYLFEVIGILATARLTSDFMFFPLVNCKPSSGLGV